MRLYTDPNDNARRHVEAERQAGYVVLRQGDSSAPITIPAVRFPAFLEAATHLGAALSADVRHCSRCRAPVVFTDDDGWSHEDTRLEHDHHAIPGTPKEIR